MGVTQSAICLRLLLPNGDQLQYHIFVVGPHMVQILMYDAVGVHQVYTNDIWDAFNYLHPYQFDVDIGNMYTNYYSFFPYDY